MADNVQGWRSGGGSVLPYQCLPITKIFREEVSIRLVRQTDNIKFAKYSCQYSKSQISHKQLFQVEEHSLEEVKTVQRICRLHIESSTMQHLSECTHMMTGGKDGVLKSLLSLLLGVWRWRRSFVIYIFKLKSGHFPGCTSQEKSCICRRSETCGDVSIVSRARAGGAKAVTAW